MTSPAPAPAPAGTGRAEWRRWGVNLAALVPVALVWCALEAEQHRSESTAAGVVRVTVSTRGFVDVLWMTGWVVWVALFLASLLPQRFRGPHRVVIVGSLLPALALSLVGSMHRSRIHATEPAIAPDGTVWRARWAWDGGMTLDRVARRSAISVTGEPVATEADTDDLAAVLVLPSNDDANAHRSTHVRFGADGTVVVGWGTRCTFAVDPAIGRQVAPSPFVLLGHAERGTEESVAEIESVLRDARDGRPSFQVAAPGEHSLLDALDSPNPWIVETARRFIRAGGPTLYPEATRRM